MTIAGVDTASPIRDALAPAAPARWRAVALLVALGAWWWPVASAFGGRDAGAITLGLVLLVPALFAARPWALSTRHLLALLPGAIAAVSLMWMPTRGDGLDEAAVWLSAGLVYLAAAGWLAQRGSPWILLAPVGVGALVQLWTGWWAWFGAGGSAAPMVGSFYWHNQFGAFMLAVAAAATGIVVHGGTLDRRLRGACVAVAAAAGAGTVFSGSRACVLLLAASFVLLAVTCFRVPRRLLALVRVGASMWVLAWVLTWLLPSSNGAGEALASRDQSATGNATARLEYFAAAWRITRTSPWTGSGADSFGSAGPALAGPFTAPTQWVHNGYLQAFVDAGVVFGLVVTGGVLAVLVLGVRRLVLDDRLLRKGQRLAPLRTGALLGVGVLAVHAAFDFDWSYPTLLALLALLSAIVLVDPGPGSEPAMPSTGLGVVRWKVAAIVTGVAAAFLASAGIDAAAATGGPVPAWRSVVTLGWAEGNVPDKLTPASQCRVELSSLLASADPVGPTLAERLESCLSRVADQDPTAARDLAELRVLTDAARG